ncbi:flagellar hook-associated protein FlgK [Helicobacter sp. MIT 14-3879]|uniref:flagellar hook-associated protein FlgK n=1 Tax=Helicobacter sp. MIT 14-3879 TaxID=2040649 RepID=UPI000E1EC560|nr:flagellar hook-associated protein FlgK [Helicobacter sp. MIT 14-3879]RDU65083.1 flagellar hook-associated protein FlgK [Helicobacter sp. MIT 14-3879]
MGGILSSLNTSTTGLNAHQLMVDVTGNNIANASDEFYSRQRVLVSPEKPLYFQNYNLGRGVDIETIQRVHDEFTFSRYRKAASDAQFYDTEFTSLREASAFFPEVDGVGIYNDIEQYFNAWKDIEKNPADSAQKQVLAQKTQTLITNIKDTRNRLFDLQLKSSEELKVTIQEINSLGKQIAEINKKLGEMEDSRELKQANELRDRRDELEFNMSKLINTNIFKDKLKSNSKLNTESADFDYGYTLNIAGGFNIVDGEIHHPIIIDNSDNENGLYTVYFQGYDFKRVDITDKISGGKSGALIDLVAYGKNGGKIGKLQEYINNLDTFTQGFIEATNSVYAQSATNELRGEVLEISNDEVLSSSKYNIKNGSFDVIIYDAKGNEMLRKSVKIDGITTMEDIVDYLNKSTDDNNDNNPLNDFDDYFIAYYDNDAKQFQILAKNPSLGLSVSIEDNGSNFAGAIGVNRFLDGNNANDISLNPMYVKDPTLIRQWKAPVNGNFDIATMMLSLQYKESEFYPIRGKKQKMSIPEYFQFVTNKVASDTNEIQVLGDTKQSVLAAVKKEFLAINQVSIDEEMVNLIKFQSGYAANAKVITTIDRMIDTLLTIKQ